MKTFQYLALGTILCFATAAGGGAANSSAEINLKVVDAELTPLRGASVALYRLDRGTHQRTRVANTASDESGDASFGDLPPARYVVRVDLTGFLDTEVGPLPLEAEDLRSHRVKPLRVLMNEVEVN